MTLLPFFEWCEASFIGAGIRASLWLFPAIECVHLLALVVLGGSVLVVDLRLMGMGLTGETTASVARQAQRWMLGGLAMMVVSGVPLFLSEAVKSYYSDAFWLKMIALVPATLFALTVRRAVASAEEDRIGPARRRLVAAASLGLWFTVAAAGRWIGFS